MGIASMLDLKAEPQDVVALDNYVQPVDRGPADARLLNSWQFQATGKVAAAAVLRDLKVELVQSGARRHFQQLTAETFGRIHEA